MQAPLGHCYWAVAPFAPSPRFAIYQQDAPPRTVPGVAAFTEAAKKGMSEFRLLTPVKVRPVLVITPVLGEYDEVLALRLRRLEKLASEAAREDVRAGRDNALFHLDPSRFPGLPVENAAIVTSLLRLPMSAIDRRESLGSLDDNELGTVHERLLRVHQLRLESLILNRARDLVTRAAKHADPDLPAAEH